MTATAVARACANAAWHSSAAAPVPRMSGGTKVCCLRRRSPRHGCQSAQARGGSSTERGQQPLATVHYQVHEGGTQADPSQPVRHPQ